MQEKRPKLVIHSYQKLWKWNMKIYALSKDLPLPRALPIKLALYAIIGFALALVIFKIPFLKDVPFALKAVFVVGVAKLLDSVKLDGKNPILFFFGLVRYFLFEQGTKIEHFKRRDARQKKIKLQWQSGSVGNKKLYTNTRSIRIKWVGGTKGGMTIV